MMRVLLLLILLFTPALAAARWYQVDVVVFRHNTAPATGAEQWPALTVIPDYSNSVDLITDEAGQDGAAPSPQPGGAVLPTAFKALTGGERGLLDAERRLRNSSQYAPMLSASWRQPKFSVIGAKRVHLSDVDPRTSPPQLESSEAAVDLSAPASTPRIEGTILVKIARQINVDVDFTYDNDGTPVRLKATRGAKLREVNYFDHPLFGVLVQIQPYDLPDDDPASGTASDEPLDESREPGAEPSSALPEPD
jgi:Peptidoglycan-binding protein, CsiV